MPSVARRNWRRIARLVLLPIALVLAVLYFLIDAVFLSFVRPVMRRLARLPILATTLAWVAGLGPYATLALFIVPLVVLEPLKPAGFYLVAKGHVVTGPVLIGLAELLKVALLERLFHMSRAKLMSIPIFARAYEFVVRWLGFLEALPPWQLVLRMVARIKALARNVAALVRGWR